jgi:hypothetical protein
MKYENNTLLEARKKINEEFEADLKAELQERQEKLVVGAIVMYCDDLTIGVGQIIRKINEKNFLVRFSSRPEDLIVQG